MIELLLGLEDLHLDIFGLTHLKNEKFDMFQKVELLDIQINEDIYEVYLLLMLDFVGLIQILMIIFIILFL
jgi:hypothetical protein